MRVTLAFVLVGLLAIEGVIGRPNHKSSSENELHSKAMEIMSPLLEKTQDPNIDLSGVMKEYEKTMAKLKLNLASLGNDTMKVDVDSCQDLKASMDEAHKLADNATILLFNILNDMSDIFGTATDCITINIFKAVSCSAHKLKDGRAIYELHKNEIEEVRKRFNDALWKVAHELVNCFKKINS